MGNYKVATESTEHFCVFNKALQRPNTNLKKQTIAALIRSSNFFIRWRLAESDLWQFPQKKRGAGKTKGNNREAFR